MLVAWGTRDGDEILTSLNNPWDRCDPVWRSGKVLDRTSRGFNSSTGPDIFATSIQCVFVSQCFIINLINYLTGLYHLFWSSHALFGVSHCLNLAKVKLIGHPQIFLKMISNNFRTPLSHVFISTKNRKQLEPLSCTPFLNPDLRWKWQILDF